MLYKIGILDKWQCKAVQNIIPCVYLLYLNLKMRLFSRNKLVKLVRFCSGTSRTGQIVTPLRKLLDQSTSYAEREALEPELQWATSPYADEGPDNQPQARTDPRDTVVLLFPGQGSQYVGMGKDLLKFPAARELYDLASSVVGWDVLRVCTAGPEAELTRRCQTCVMVSSLAALERLREERPSALERARAAAGFSLGEITALTWAGAMSFEQALRLVEVRSAAMEAASRDHPGAMLTVWLAPDARLSEALRRATEHARARNPDAHCSIASYLYPECKVIAGSKEAVEWLEREGRAWGVRRSARVAASGAFHTAAMRDAVEAVRAALALCEVRVPSLAVWSSVDGKLYRSAAQVRARLPRQVVAPVRWEQTLHAMFARDASHGFPLTCAVGPGRSMRATLRQVNAKAWDTSVQVDT